MDNPRRTLAFLAVVYIVLGWCMYAQWATSSHPDCQRALTPECYDRVFADRK
jgi:hypothetical protein